MSSFSQAEQSVKRLIADMALPDSFQCMVQEIYRPLAELIVNRKRQSPLLVSIHGAQGSGKSTLCRFLQLLIETEYSARVALFSLDDFYYSQQKRNQLAREIHPLLVSRGVPGTHNLSLLVDVIDALITGQSCCVPAFSKAQDEPLPKSEWQEYSKPVDIILFEGWCNNSPPQSEDDLRQPVNELEAEQDAQGIWRSFCNESLKRYHQRVFDFTDLNIMLRIPDFKYVYQWRSLQEQKLSHALATGGTSKTMNTNQLRRFIQHFERITRHSLIHLPEKSDLLLPVSENHSITDIIVQ